MARVVVRRSCCAFWSTFSATLLVSCVGYLLMWKTARDLGEESIMRKQTRYDFLVASSEGSSGFLLRGPFPPGSFPAPSLLRQRNRFSHLHSFTVQPTVKSL